MHPPPKQTKSTAAPLSPATSNPSSLPFLLPTLVVRKQKERAELSLLHLSNRPPRQPPLDQVSTRNTSSSTLLQPILRRLPHPPCFGDNSLRQARQNASHSPSSGQPFRFLFPSRRTRPQASSSSASFVFLLRSPPGLLLHVRQMKTKTRVKRRMKRTSPRTSGREGGKKRRKRSGCSCLWRRAGACSCTRASRLP